MLTRSTECAPPRHQAVVVDPGGDELVNDKSVTARARERCPARKWLSRPTESIHHWSRDVRLDPLQGAGQPRREIGRAGSYLESDLKPRRGVGQERLMTGNEDFAGFSPCEFGMADLPTGFPSDGEPVKVGADTII